MKKFKIVGGIIATIVAANVGVSLYFDIPRHINDIVTENNAHPEEPRKSAHQVLSEAFDRAFDEKYGPV